MTEMNQRWRSAVGGPLLLLVGSALLMALSRGGTARAPEAPLDGLDAEIARAMRDWDVPGLALAIVKDDEVVLARGYGVRKLGAEARVDEHTVFAIASCTKAFTAAALALLVDEGKLAWDDPVGKHLPGFQMCDPYATRELTVRDLLCHRGGLERHDLAWLANPTLSREGVTRLLRHAKPSWSFRSKAGYQNMLFGVAGQVVAVASGKSWDDFVRERFFAPLKMTASSTSLRDLAKARNVASGHQKIDGKLVPVAPRNLDNIAPAGAIESTATDMAQWARLQLNGGKLGKQRLLSAAAVKEMHTPQTIVRLERHLPRIYPETRFMAYGLGWRTFDHRGAVVIEHGGSIDGMIAQVALVPEEKLGIVVLTNRRPNYLTTALVNRILDRYRRAAPRDWSTELRKVARSLEEEAEHAERKEEKERVKGTRPSLAPAKYAGLYRDELYGEVKVTEEKGKLTVRLGTAFVGELEHWHYDTFRVRWADRTRGKSLVTFRLGARGEVAEVRISYFGDVVVAKRGPSMVAPPPRK